MTAAIDSRLLSSLPLIRRGKVRDCYRYGDDLLFVATDRISAFDVVLPSEIECKGAVLNQLAAFWFDRTRHIIPNHLIRLGLPADVESDDRPWFDARTTVAREAQRIDVECVVRGYLAGSAWAEYRRTGAVAGHTLDTGLLRAMALPVPIFTPALKNDEGHDENISIDRFYDLMGRELGRLLESTSLALYRYAADVASQVGLILADTKFEFGLVDGTVTLIDEILTPDSSRYWDAATYEPGREPASFDKQYVRNWLDSSGWNHDPPGPELPPDVIEGTRERYFEAFRRLTGNEPTC